MVDFAWRLPQRTLVAAILLVMAASGALAQEKVGISSAVNPQASGTPPGGSSRQLVIGQDVVFNERIATTAEGQTQLLFLDESSMSVGPNSDLTIDQFVYDPKSGTGKLAMSATRGLLRYVGGKLSKQDNAVTLKTSTATLAVRGGAFIINITSGGQTEVIFLYGNALTISGVNGVVKSITRPGFEITVSATGNMSSPQPAPSQQLAQFTGELDGRTGGNGGATVVPTDSVVTTASSPLTQTLQQSLQQVINTSFPQQVNVNSVQTSVNPQPNTAPQLIVCATISSCSTSVSVGTLPSQSQSPSPPTTKTGYSGVANSTNSATSGFTNPNSTFANGTVTFPQGSNQAVFSGTAGSLGTLTFPLVEGSATSFGPVGTSSNFGTFSGTSFLSGDGTYFYAEITPTSQPSQRLYVSGGLPVSSSFYSPVTGAGDRPNVNPATGMNTNTRIFAFTVRPDGALQSPTPFVPNQLGGIVPNSNVSPFYVVAPGTASIGSTSTSTAARGLQASLAINGQGASQQSAIAVTTGTIGTLQSSGQPVFNGQMVGSSMLSANATPTTLSSGVSSAVDANGNSFYGNNSISGFTLTSTGYSTASNGTVGSPATSTATATSLSGATTTYGFNQPAIATSVPTPNGVEVGTNRTSQTLSGNVGGLMYSNQQSTPYIVTGGAIVTTDAPNNRVQATLIATPQTASGNVTGLTVQYGGLTGNANQAFVDNSNFGATSQGPQTVSVNGTPTSANGQMYFVSSATAGVPTQLLPAGASFCQCQYLQWGYWGGSLSTPQVGSPTPRIDAANINFWTAGSPTPLTDLNTLITQGAMATYNGAAIGSVYNAGASYVAAGGFQGTYNFGTQSGSFALNNFDGHSFSASGSAPLSGANYTFAINQTGVTGKVNGTFYGPAAAETGGNFGFQSTVGPTYIASGVFAGKKQ